jgi:hypothetical protein
VKEPRALSQVEIIAIDEIAQLPDALPYESKYFTLLLAWNASSADLQNIDCIFRPLIDRGLAYFCVWGNLCSELHDALDLSVIQNEIERGEADYLLMTTWHEHEPLEDAFEFFNMLAIPSECHVFNDFRRYAVAVGNSNWTTIMQGPISTSGTLS